MNRLTIALGLCLAGTALAPAVPQVAAAPAATQAVDERSVVEDVRRILRENYVIPETRAKLDAALAQGLQSGRYDVDSPTDLATRINADLDAVAHDKHLGMRFDAAESARLAAQPPGSGADDAPATEEAKIDARRANHGIVELKVLPGNIRYMEIRGFLWSGEESARAYDSAMRFLADGYAAIIDIRRNGGGSPDAVKYAISPFLKPNTPIVTFHMRSDEPLRVSSLAKPSVNLAGKPLYVLTSSGSASAAEEFAGHVKGYKLGELIGETTAGAGYRNEFFPVTGGYVISVSVGRAVLASTGEDWEGRGIAPTVAVKPDKALDVAQIHALRRVASQREGGERDWLEAQARLLAAKVDPVTTALPLSAYAGTFGERSVAVEDGGLIYRRGEAVFRLVAIGPNSFTFEDDPMGKVEFAVANSSVNSFELIRGDGSRLTAPRTR